MESINKNEEVGIKPKVDSSKSTEISGGQTKQSIQEMLKGIENLSKEFEQNKSSSSIDQAKADFEA